MIKNISIQDVVIPNILVIDDEQSICNFFEDLFSEFGITIDTVTNGSDGLKRILTQRYALIFLDVKLGDVNGIDLLKVIKKNAPEIPVIMISAYFTEEIIYEITSLGAEGYLEKPLSILDIIRLTLTLTNSNILKEWLKNNPYFKHFS